jgi:hypothetical protein
MKKIKFKIGDLVREKKITSSQVGEFGIVTLSLKIGDMIKYRCAWSDEKEYWKKEANLYLVARGQNGSTS